MVPMVSLHSHTDREREEERKLFTMFVCSWEKEREMKEKIKYFLRVNYKGLLAYGLTEFKLPTSSLKVGILLA